MKDLGPGLVLIAMTTSICRIFSKFETILLFCVCSPQLLAGPATEIAFNRASQKVELRFPVEAGIDYTIESSKDPESGEWETVLEGAAGQTRDLTISIRYEAQPLEFYRVRSKHADSSPVVYTWELESETDGTLPLIESIMISPHKSMAFLRKSNASGFYLIMEDVSCEAHFDETGMITEAVLDSGDVLTIDKSTTGRKVTIVNRLERVVGDYLLPIEAADRVVRSDDEPADSLSSVEMVGQLSTLLESLMVAGNQEGAEEWSAAAQSAADLIIEFGSLISEAAVSDLATLGFTPGVVAAFTGSDDAKGDPSLPTMEVIGGQLWRVARTLEEAKQIDGPFIYRPECLELRNQVNAVVGSLVVLQLQEQLPLLFEGGRHWFNGSYQAELQEMLENALLFIQMYQIAQAEMGDYCFEEADGFVLVMDEIEMFLSDQQSLLESYRVPNLAVYVNSRRARDSALALGLNAAAEQMEQNMANALNNVLEVNTAIFTIGSYRDSFIELRGTVAAWIE